MAGRKPGFDHLQKTRDKIKASLIVNRLCDHVLSDTPLMDTSQVNAAKALLNKVLPDVSSVSIDASVSGDMTFVMKTVYEEKPGGD